MQFGVSQQTKKKNGIVNASTFPNHPGAKRVLGRCLCPVPPASSFLALPKKGVPVALVPLPQGGERHELLAQARKLLTDQ